MPIYIPLTSWTRLILLVVLFISQTLLPAQISDYSDCRKCQGTGTYPTEKSCGNCGGDGHLTETIACKGCGGDGRFIETCTDCNGHGHTVGTSKRTEYRTEVQACAKCGGSGALRCACCGGSRQVLVYGMVQWCGCCGATGVVRCDFCKGNRGVQVTVPYNVSVEKKYPCTRCSGTGEVKPKHALCSGTGKLTKTSDCLQCKATGKITKRITCQHEDLVVAKPRIVWDYPSTKSITISQATHSVKACVTSSSKIISSRIYLNGVPYGERGISVEANCDQVLTAKMPFNCGINKVLVKVTNSGGETTSEVLTITRIECETPKDKEDVVKPSPSPNTTYYLLAMAVESYTDIGIPPLYNPIKDAQKLINVLKTNYTFDEKNITFLKNPKREDMIVAFETLQKKLKKTDNLLVFFAGHGKMQNSTGYWLPADAGVSSTTRWLSSSTLSDQIRDMPAKHTLVISDACFSGSLVLRDFESDSQNKTCDVLNKLPSRRALTSNALAATPDDSVFLQYILKKLEGNTNACLTDQELHSLIVKPVIANSPNQQTPQYGTIRETGDEGGCFIFYKKM
jgi:hypothetical protein